MFRMHATRLNVRRPSPTTTQYTVSNRRSFTSALSKTYHFLGLIVRSLVAFSLATILVVLLGEVLSSLKQSKQGHSTFSAPLHQWAFEYHLPSGGAASWICIVSFTIALWLVSRRASIGELIHL